MYPFPYLLHSTGTGFMALPPYDRLKQIVYTSKNTLAYCCGVYIVQKGVYDIIRSIFLFFTP